MYQGKDGEGESDYDYSDSKEFSRKNPRKLNLMKKTTVEKVDLNTINPKKLVEKTNGSSITKTIRIFTKPQLKKLIPLPTPLVPKSPLPQNDPLEASGDNQSISYPIPEKKKTRSKTIGTREIDNTQLRFKNPNRKAIYSPVQMNPYMGQSHIKELKEMFRKSRLINNQVVLSEYNDDYLRSEKEEVDFNTFIKKSNDFSQTQDISNVGNKRNQEKVQPKLEGKRNIPKSSIETGNGIENIANVGNKEQKSFELQLSSPNQFKLDFSLKEQTVRKNTKSIKPAVKMNMNNNSKVDIDNISQNNGNQSSFGQKFPAEFDIRPYIQSNVSPVSIQFQMENLETNKKAEEIATEIPNASNPISLKEKRDVNKPRKLEIFQSPTFLFFKGNKPSIPVKKTMPGRFVENRPVNNDLGHTTPRSPISPKNFHEIRVGPSSKKKKALLKLRKSFGNISFYDNELASKQLSKPNTQNTNNSKLVTNIPPRFGNNKIQNSDSKTYNFDSHGATINSDTEIKQKYKEPSKFILENQNKTKFLDIKNNRNDTADNKPMKISRSSLSLQDHLLENSRSNSQSSSFLILSPTADEMPEDESPNEGEKSSEGSSSKDSETVGTSSSIELTINSSASTVFLNSDNTSGENCGKQKKLQNQFGDKQAYNLDLVHKLYLEMQREETKIGLIGMKSEKKGSDANKNLEIDEYKRIIDGLKTKVNTLLHQNIVLQSQLTKVNGITRTQTYPTEKRETGSESPTVSPLYYQLGSSNKSVTNLKISGPPNGMADEQTSSSVISASNSDAMVKNMMKMVKDRKSGVMNKEQKNARSKKFYNDLRASKSLNDGLNNLKNLDINYEKPKEKNYIPTKIREKGLYINIGSNNQKIGIENNEQERKIGTIEALIKKTKLKGADSSEKEVSNEKYTYNGLYKHKNYTTNFYLNKPPKKYENMTFEYNNKKNLNKMPTLLNINNLDISKKDEIQIQENKNQSQITEKGTKSKEDDIEINGENKQTNVDLKQTSADEIFQKLLVNKSLDFKEKIPSQERNNRSSLGLSTNNEHVRSPTKQNGEKDSTDPGTTDIRDDSIQKDIRILSLTSTISNLQGNIDAYSYMIDYKLSKIMNNLKF
ncbi:hypothetical protein BB558_002617 [Smittium angustum]|uniref:Uncharacterized protein n=1 Tax=Smittium angustum TaxID=133377 RepID=A0A2U1J883_SMIAN|nr:hypothetical protein BB558_002617 [Smittium angustum]